MWEKIIEYFSCRHLLTNFIFVAIFVGGIFFWHHTSKEELPDVAFDTISISAFYPGASPEEVEHFITKPIENEIKGLDGIFSIRSTSSVGSCSIRVELEQDNPDRDDVVAEIKDTVLGVKLPNDVIDQPRIREFKTSKKAIIDIGLIHTGKHLLDNKSRRFLQTYALALENQLLNLKEVNSINRSGYLKEEIQIKAYPSKLNRFNIPFNTVMKEIKRNNIRQPAGSINSREESKVTLVSELDNIKKLKNLIVQGGFDGQVIRLKQVADVIRGFEKNNSILKINGNEGIMLNVVKSSSYGILESVDAVKKTVKDFRQNNLKGSPVKIVLLDDESMDVRNRLYLISMNGIIGFILILTMLFLFLNFSSGIWVAMGIPFTFCFTMIITSLMGFTINNITLAAVIIVMGMVVDDAIIVAENITRLRNQGVPQAEAVVKGTSFVFLPIVASILTTCVAFFPLLAFSGRFVKMIKFIPPIIFIMLAGSLLESIFILPAHMNLKMPKFLRIIFSLGTLPFIEKYFGRSSKKKKKKKRHWFYKMEDVYGKIIQKILNYKWIIFASFFALMILAGIIFKTKMKFVMFPSEETTQFRLMGIAGPGVKKYETARLSKQIEDILAQYIGKEIVGFRTQIARSRRGSAVEENKMAMRIQVVSKEKREKSLNQLLAEWNKKMKKVKGFIKLSFIKQRFGRSADASPIEVIIQENNDDIRDKVSKIIAMEMEKHSALSDVDIEQPLKNPEYKVTIKRDKIKRLGINPVDIASTLRALLEGTILYELTGKDEDIQVRFTAVEQAKDDIYKVLNVPVENQGNYLVPLMDIVNIKKVVSPNSITRQDFKRTTRIHAEMKEKSKLTPVEVAEFFESKIFPAIMSKYPTTVLSFGGEVKDTRESKSDFLFAIIMILFLIYVILALLFNSLYKPLLIMLTIPFGAVGIILAFYLHGITQFGFFAGIGALGLVGVVVNDSIVMLVKLEKEYDRLKHKDMSSKQIANIAKTRLRAVILTTLTTVAGLLPTAYGFAGYDSMLAEMMLALSWGLMFGTFITLLLIPSLYSLLMDTRHKINLLDKKYSKKAGVK